MKRHILRMMCVGVIAANSGCMACRYVYSIGERRECLSRKQDGQIIIAKDGSMAIAVQADYVTDTSDGPRTVYSRSKYLIGDAAAVSNSIWKFAQAQEHGLTNMLYITHFPRVSTNEANWRVEPSRFGESSTHIPVGFTGDAFITTRQPFIYSLNGRNCQVEIGMWNTFLDADVERREKRTWWGYPIQILQVPAFLIDIVTFPLQAYYMLSHLRIA